MAVSTEVYVALTAQVHQLTAERDALKKRLENTALGDLAERKDKLAEIIVAAKVNERIDQLTAERDALKAEVKELKVEYSFQIEGLAAENERLRGQLALDKAEQQFVGFCHGRSGYDITSLVESMGLIPGEWAALKEDYVLTLSASDKAEIDEYFQQENSDEDHD